MPDNDSTLAELKDVAVRQLAALEELLVAYRDVTSRQKKALRVQFWGFALLVPGILVLYSYLLYVAWWNLSGQGQ